MDDNFNDSYSITELSVDLVTKLIFNSNQNVRYNIVRILDAQIKNNVYGEEIQKRLLSKVESQITLEKSIRTKALVTNAIGKRLNISLDEIKELLEIALNNELDPFWEFELAFILTHREQSFEGKGGDYLRAYNDKYGLNSIQEECINSLKSRQLTTKIIQSFLSNLKSNKKEKEKAKKKENKVVFISYSWDSEQHKDWVRKLAENLVSNGVEVLLDQWYIKPGISIPDFMEKIVDSDYVLVICTNGYMEKLKQVKGGVKFEDSIIKAQVLKGLKFEKVIPIFREGIDIVPPYLSDKYGLKMDDDREYQEKLEELLRHIFGKHKLKPPKLGKPPDFSND